MRLLFISQGRKPEDHPGYHEALLRLVGEGALSAYHNLPYIGFEEDQGYEALWDEIVRLAETQEADVVYFQYFHRKQNQDPTRCINRLRALPYKPTVVTSCGDAFSSNWMWPHFPESFKICARLSDLTFSTQMGRVGDLMTDWGVSNIVLLPHGLCQVRFGIASQADLENTRNTFDVVWVGSNRKLKPNLWNRVFWNGLRRRDIVKLLTRRYGESFGLFGHGWEGNPSWRGSVPFTAQQEAFRQGRIFIDAIPDPFGERYYASDRPFFALASGVPVILFEKPGLDRLLRRNEHAYFVKDEQELLAMCDQLLGSDLRELQTKALDTAAFIGANHTQYHRMRFAIDTIRNYRRAKSEKRLAPVPFLPYLLPEVVQQEESKQAVRNWIG